jgi:hypothetical protein
VEPDCGQTHRNGYYTLGYAEDIAILIHRTFPYTVSELLQETLSTVQQWCDRTQLSIYPQTMVILPFTWKRDLRGLKEPTLSRHTLQLATEVKYLGKAYRAFGPVRANLVKPGV